MPDPIAITIDGRTIEVAPGGTILTAARALGLEIPTLCYLEKCGPLTSCLACVVKVNGRLVPSCATKAQPGMTVESETAEVHQARRTALELLLSDHVGDCLSPCHRICPLGLNIPRMLRQIQANKLEEAAGTLKESIALGAVLGRLCHRPCENGCRRALCDSAAAIRDLERFVADTHLAACSARTVPTPKLGGKPVVIVGAGPTGLAAAYQFIRHGYHCTVVDHHAVAGGTLRSVPETDLPPSVLDEEIGLLTAMGVQFKLGVVLGKDLTLEGLLRGFQAVLLAIGDSTQELARQLGLTTTPTGIEVNPDSFATNMRHVFAAGSAVKPIKPLIRAMVDGRDAAECIHQSLAGLPLQKWPKPFSSIMGRVEPAEARLFLRCAHSGNRLEPSAGPRAGFNLEEAILEARRCLHCDCRSAGNCQLQYFAQRYQADPGRFRTQRRPFEQHLQQNRVIFEPGKCIVCGICVQLAEQAREPLGLTFINRGFDVRVAAPFDRTIADGLQKVAVECVEHCPTGALVFREEI